MFLTACSIIASHEVNQIETSEKENDEESDPCVCVFVLSLRTVLFGMLWNDLLG